MLDLKNALKYEARLKTGDLKRKNPAKQAILSAFEDALDVLREIRAGTRPPLDTWNKDDTVSGPDKLQKEKIRDA